MIAVCAACQTTFETQRTGRQQCPHCRREVWLPGPDDPGGGWVGPAAMPAGGAAQGPAVRPGFILWYRIWCWTMAAFDLGAIGFGVAGAAGAFTPGGPKADDVAVGAFLVLAGLALLAGHVVVPLLPRGKLAYYLNLALLAVCVLVCCWPLAIVFLIQFNKPETRRWYGV